MLRAFASRNSNRQSAVARHSQPCALAQQSIALASITGTTSNLDVIRAMRPAARNRNYMIKNDLTGSEFLSAKVAGVAVALHDGESVNKLISYAVISCSLSVRLMPVVPCSSQGLLLFFCRSISPIVLVALVVFVSVAFKVCVHGVYIPVYLTLNIYRQIVSNNRYRVKKIISTVRYFLIDIHGGVGVRWTHEYGYDESARVGATARDRKPVRAVSRYRTWLCDMPSHVERRYDSDCFRNDCQALRWTQNETRSAIRVYFGLAHLDASRTIISTIPISIINPPTGRSGSYSVARIPKKKSYPPAPSSLVSTGFARASFCVYSATATRKPHNKQHYPERK
jgi:hypothetical protein